MKDRILLNVVSANKRISYNASDKARTDVERTLVRNGYNIIEIPYAKYLSKWKATIIQLIDIIKAVNKIRKIRPEDIIIQYPGFRLGTRAIDVLTRLLKRNHVTILIHDIDSLRVYGKISDREKSILNRAKRIFVHTYNMHCYLRDNGVTVPMQELWLFDYYANGMPIRNKLDGEYSIVFAGNLKKSSFLKNLNNVLYPYTMYLYGLPVEWEWDNGLQYEGKFAPDEIINIKGDWGLVWDGESTETCDGNIGNYLKFNSSHKASLYLAAGKPVIVWKQSGIAPFIEKHHLGLCIDTLKDIPNLLNTISVEDYKKYTQNVQSIQIKLRNGKMLENHIIK